MTGRRRLRVCVRGVVQGVGFRPFVYACAAALGLSGSVRNDSAGAIIEVEGDAADVDDFLDRLRDRAAAAGGHRIRRDAGHPGRRRHRLRHRRHVPVGRRPHAGLPRRRHVRRLRWPSCATRPTGATGTRSSTAPTADRGSPSSPRCPTTGRAPRWPASRCAPTARASTPTRPTAASTPSRSAARDCGPTLQLPRPAAATTDGEDGAAPRRGGCCATAAILAVKGIGGYHLACDAGNERAVAELRQRKRRGDKPFAVMVRRPGRRAHAIADVDDARSGCSPRSAAADRAAAAAGRGAPVADVGRAGQPRPRRDARLHPAAPPAVRAARRRAGPAVLVMTSGNLGGEPICFTDDDDALTGSRGLADGWLMHDRRDPRAVRRLGGAACVDGVELPIRRSRGYAPLPVALPVPRAADAGRRRRPEEHLRRRRRPVRLAEPAHRRHGRPRHPVGVRRGRAAPRARSPASRPELVVADAHPRLPLRPLGAPQRRRPAGPAGAAPPRPHRRGDGRARPRRRRSGARLRLRRHRLRRRRRGLGRRGAARRLQGLPAAGAPRRTCRCPAATSACCGPYRMALSHLWAAGLPWDDDLPPVRGLPGRRAPRAARTSSRPGSAACRPPAWAGCSTRSPSLAGVRQVGRLRGPGGDRAGGPGPRRRLRHDRVRASTSTATQTPAVIDPAPVLARGRRRRARRRAARRDRRPVPPRGRRPGRRPRRRLRDRTADTVALSRRGVPERAAAAAAPCGAARPTDFDVLTHRRVPPNDGGLALGQLLVGGTRRLRGKEDAMCLAVPGRILSIEDRDGTLMAEVDFGGVREGRLPASTSPTPQVGEYVIVHVGFALQRLDEESAMRDAGRVRAARRARGGVRRRVRAGRRAGRAAPTDRQPPVRHGGDGVR